MNAPKKAVRRTAAREIAYIALGVALITVCAWISVPVGAIPVTLQTFAIALVGGLLGVRRGSIAVLVYFLMGAIGIPVFSGFRSGAAALLGATGGYLIGFLFEALLPACVKRLPVRNIWARTGLFYVASVVGLAILYTFGTIWFLTVYNAGGASEMGVGAALAVCVLPYLLPDALKIAVASVLTVRLERFVH